MLFVLAIAKWPHVNIRPCLYFLLFTIIHWFIYLFFCEFLSSNRPEVSRHFILSSVVCIVVVGST